VAPGGAVAVIGTGDVKAVAARLAALGVTVGPVFEACRVTRILGGHEVTGIEADGRVTPCDAVVHAGPWRTDPALGFQAATGGALRLVAQAGRGNVTVVGSAAEAPEPMVWGGDLDDGVLVCPCMDVTVAEVRALVAAGETHVEVVKRLTGCGMGACQGFPCWDQLGAALAALTGRAVEDRPTFRPPRGALTLAQAAGLAEVVGPEP
jgi:bacterioferritin-associated ferredoxin